MGLHNNLIRVERDTVHYPDTKMKTCSLLDSDNSTYEADLLPTEVDILINFIVLKDKLSASEIKRLSDMIEAYGDERAEVAVVEESIE
jgi:hypothetical protein